MEGIAECHQIDQNIEIKNDQNIKKNQRKPNHRKSNFFPIKVDKIDWLFVLDLTLPILFLQFRSSDQRNFG